MSIVEFVVRLRIVRLIWGVFWFQFIKCGLRHLVSLFQKHSESPTCVRAAVSSDCWLVFLTAGGDESPHTCII